ncbi:MBOAT family protein [Acutalibacter sp. 1XD8-33]|uniref:MBOAT family O-acyltransferase n=1 Tax=Acutalibacter sp. 1XD8-33 TaxID=2320081 RepID=UPI000EA2353F|nr:MBOAT family protein [Acutalibacter sp. 1XD8-33]RKJ41219.1 MBOAT family protein [Acutalibacter sp. 1XD8-33]
MVFSSPAFLFAFLPVTFLLSRLIPHRTAQNALLAVLSLVFYAFGEPVYVLLLLGSVGINYLSGVLLCSRLNKKAVLAAAVLLNLGILCVFKYADFAVDTLNRLGLSLPQPGIALPIGISFFTFQGLSYLIDCYRDRSLVSRSFLKLTLYIAFFPQLIAGPIVKYHQVSQQIDHREMYPALTADGIRRFILGLGKKLLLSNTLGQMADLVFLASPAQLDARSAWLGAFCYMLQIYFDFSGYSDMAIGLGRMFGFQFEENFRYPYASGSIKEFWRRWHISLSSWFRDYLYIPLGGNRKGRFRTELNKCLVFFCTGLWHGASWSFVLWGLWHGFFIILEDLLPPPGKLRRILWRPVTLLAVLLGFVLFRADSLPVAGTVYSAMAGTLPVTLESAALLRALLSPLNILILVAACFCALPLLPRIKAFASGESAGASVLRIASYGAAIGIFLLCVLNLSSTQFNPFIYFRF